MYTMATKIAMDDMGSKFQWFFFRLPEQTALRPMCTSATLRQVVQISIWRWKDCWWDCAGCILELFWNLSLSWGWYASLILLLLGISRFFFIYNLYLYMHKMGLTEIGVSHKSGYIIYILYYSDLSVTKNWYHGECIGFIIPGSPPFHFSEYV